MTEYREKSGELSKYNWTGRFQDRAETLIVAPGLNVCSGADKAHLVGTVAAKLTEQFN